MGSRDFYEQAGYSRQLEPGAPLTARDMLVVVVGETLSGKTALVNGIEANRVSHGVWKGSTVSRVAIDLPIMGRTVRVLDLPGSHGTSMDEIEELVRSEVGRPEPQKVILQVVNADVIPKSLPFTLELCELNVPVLLGLRVYKRASAEGRLPNLEAIKNIVDIPILTEIGDQTLDVEGIAKIAATAQPPSFTPRYVEALEKSLAEISNELNYNTSRWLALAALQGLPVELPTEAQIKATQQSINWRESGSDVVEAIKSTRLHLAQIVLLDGKSEVKPSQFASLIGKLLDSSPWAVLAMVPILAFMLLHLAFLVAHPWMSWIGQSATILGKALAALPIPKGFSALLNAGIVGGLGTLLSLVPTMFAFYLVLRFLDSSGLAVRFGKSLKRLFAMAGVSERAVNPLLQAMGCSLRGIRSVRELAADSDKLRTALAVPFVPCGARLAFIACIAALFFPKGAAGLVVGAYLLGWLLALIVLLLTKRFSSDEAEEQREKDAPIPFMIPPAGMLIREAWSCTLEFLRAAFLPLLGAVIAVWSLMQVGGWHSGSLFQDIAGAFGAILKPLGLSDWRLSGTLLAGICSKEAMLATAALSFQGSAEHLSFVQALTQIGNGLVQAALATCKGVMGYFSWASLGACPEDLGFLAKKFSAVMKPGQAMAYMAFTAFATPCLPVIMEIKALSGLKWALGSWVLQFALAWVAALILSFCA